MFEKRIEQLKLQRQNSNDSLLLEILENEFYESKSSDVFKPFEIPYQWKIENVQAILSLIDPRLIAVPDDNVIIISM